MEITDEASKKFSLNIKLGEVTEEEFYAENI